MTFLRSGLGWSQAELGEAANVSPSLLNDYEHGRKDLKRDRLEFLVSFMGHRPKEIDADRVPAESSSPSCGALGGEALGAIAAVNSDFQPRVPAVPEAKDRTGGGSLGAPGAAQPRQRTALVEEDEDFQTWALSELVAAKSIEKAPTARPKP